MLTLQKVVIGLGSAGGTTYKDIYKACRQCMTDRSMMVRSAAAKVSNHLCSTFHFSWQKGNFMGTRRN